MELKTTFEFSRYHPNMLIHKVELTILIHKMIVFIDASADELRYHHVKVHQDVEATLSKHGILSRIKLSRLKFSTCRMLSFLGDLSRAEHAVL